MKKFLALLVLTVLVISLVGCSSGMSGYIEDVAKEVPEVYIDFEIIDSDTLEGWTILYDKNTKVMYVILDGYQSTGMTPILNEDGTPKLYEGD